MMTEVVRVGSRQKKISFLKSSSPQALVWKRAFAKHQRMLDENASSLYPSYHVGFAKLDLSPENPPSLEFLNDKLSKVGWSGVWGDGYVAPWEFYRMLRCKQFPIGKSWRSLTDLDHAPAPDFIHDVFGHLPLLFDPEITRLNLELACFAESLPITLLDQQLDAATHALLAVSSEHENSVFEKKLMPYLKIKEQMTAAPTPLMRLGRIYHWVLEFGVTETEQIFGSGILSSKTEVERIVQKKVPIVEFSDAILNYDIDFFGTQEQFFALKAFSDVQPVLEQLSIEEVL